MNWDGHLIMKSSKGVINLFGADHIPRLEVSGIKENSVWNRVGMPGKAQYTKLKSFFQLEKSARRTPQNNKG